MRVAELADGFFPAVGGGAAAIDSWIRQMPDIDFDVLTNHLPGAPLRERRGPNCTILRFLPSDVTATPLNAAPFKPISIPYKVLADWLRFSRKLEYLMRSRVDLVHFNGPITNYGFFAVDRALRKPLLTKRIDFSRVEVPKLITLHGLPSLITHSPVDLENERRQVRSFDTVVVVDRYMLDVVTPIARETDGETTVRFVPNGVDVRAFAYREPPTNRELIIGFLGRLDAAKGAPLLVEIAENLPRGVRLEVAAAGRRSRWVRALSRLDRVSVHENLPYARVPEFLASIHLLLNPVMVPGISRATLEAMSVGRPVVMPPIMDRYPIVPEETGFLCPPQSGAMLALISWAADERQTLEKMGARARERIEREFSAEVVALELRAAFLRTVGRGA